MSLMDKFLPSYQFSERHQVMVRAAPGELLDIIQNFQPPNDRFGETAMLLRQLPARLMHLLAPSRTPRPSAVTRANFIPLARDGDREMVGGLSGNSGVRISGWSSSRTLPASCFAILRKHAKLVIGFAAEQSGEVTLLATETRVYCPDRYSLMMFFPYWLIIRPVSGLLRRRFLGSVRRRAESRAGMIR